MQIDDDKLLQKYKTIRTKIKDLNIKFNVLPVYDNRYMENKRTTNGDRSYTIFRGFKVPEDGVDCKSSTIISIDSLLV